MNKYTCTYLMLGSHNSMKINSFQVNKEKKKENRTEKNNQEILILEDKCKTKCSSDNCKCKKQKHHPGWCGSVD